MKICKVSKVIIQKQTMYLKVEADLVEEPQLKQRRLYKSDSKRSQRLEKLTLVTSYLITLIIS